jgi:hypothetical protein
MKIAILSTPIVVGFPHELFPTTGFPESGPNQEFLTENNAKFCYSHKTHDPLTEVLEQCEPYEEGEYVYIVKAKPLTSEEIEAQKSSSMQNVRFHRTLLLKECDWTQLEDVPAEIKSVWLEYRQALRDITKNVTDARNTSSIVWPTKPTNVTE